VAIEWGSLAQGLPLSVHESHYGPHSLTGISSIPGVSMAIELKTIHHSTQSWFRAGLNRVFWLLQLGASCP